MGQITNRMADEKMMERHEKTRQKREREGEGMESKRIRGAAMCWVITLVSFGGFCVENVFVALTDRYIDNRNMLLPFLFGYGLGIAAIYGLFGTPASPHLGPLQLLQKRRWLGHLYYFAVVFLSVSVGECLLGLFVEHFFDITWWDYSAIPLHVTKFTSVPTSTGFTFLIMAFMQLVFEPLFRALQRVNPRVLYTLAVLFMVLLSLDFIASGLRMYVTHDFVRIWKISW